MPDVLGTLQKIVACTPNREFDAAAYERGVLVPARRIRRLAEAHADAPESLAPEALAAALDDLLTILATKQVDPEERVEHVTELLDRHGLHDRFPDLIARARGGA